MSISKYISIFAVVFSLGMIACSNTATSEKATAKAMASTPAKEPVNKKANVNPKKPLSNTGIELVLKTTKATKQTKKVFSCNSISIETSSTQKTINDSTIQKR